MGLSRGSSSLVGNAAKNLNHHLVFFFPSFINLFCFSNSCLYQRGRENREGYWWRGEISDLLPLLDIAWDAFRKKQLEIMGFVRFSIWFLIYSIFLSVCVCEWPFSEKRVVAF
jgi:hypothetical protein